jgi:hypothetical protein
MRRTGPASVQTCTSPRLLAGRPTLGTGRKGAPEREAAFSCYLESGSPCARGAAASRQRAIPAAGHFGRLHRLWEARRLRIGLLDNKYEPAGEAHTLVASDDSPEPVLVFSAVEGGLIYLTKAVDGGFGAYEDGFTLLELCRKYYREADLDVRELDALIR